MDDNSVIVACLNKLTGFVETYTICDKAHAQSTARCYRNAGHKARTVTYEELCGLYDKELESIIQAY